MKVIFLKKEIISNKKKNKKRQIGNKRTVVNIPQVTKISFLGKSAKNLRPNHGLLLHGVP